MITGIPIIDAVVSIGGLILPPAMDFIKKKFLKQGTDTPEATLSALATTKPEIMPQYVKAQADLMDAQTRFFNRDVVGQPSSWVVDLRAAIRPIVVVLSIGMLGMTMFTNTQIDPGVRVFCEAVISSWFGSRFTIGGKD